MIIEALEGMDALHHATECARIHAAAFTPSGSRGWSAQEFDDLFRTPGSILFKAPDAFLLAQMQTDQSEILTFAVTPDCQRTGRGKALVEEFVACSVRFGTEKCLLEVAVDNLAAVSLYRLVSFRIIARRKNYFLQNGVRIDGFVMERSLR